MSSKEVIRILKKEGWKYAGSVGSHQHFEHPTIKGKITVPHPRKDLPTKTLNSIKK